MPITYDTKIQSQQQKGDKQPRNGTFPRRLDARWSSRKSIAQDKIVSIPISGIPNGSLNYALLNSAQIAVTVSAGQTSGSSSVTSGWKILGYYPTAQDQVVKSIVISGTTLTVTLLVAASADNHFTVNVIAP